ncbi:nuclear poly(A) polymerase 3 isoform X2 [Senna tora]|uniref:Nuclear poly(A) polymerase 3 isoform X2 n=1 Tax=Senna tora TaxID=362788 RepID=A0A834TQ02_9FABA|nr:nuclear poly(A) polymerase 3 isoform X2 [Senna tora]
MEVPLMVEKGLVTSTGWEIRMKLVIQKSSQSKSGIDVLCVDPFFSSMVEDIFGDLHEMLERRPKISNIHCGKSAKVPVTQFKCDGGSVEGLVPSAGWEMRRKLVIQKLK